MAQVLNDNRKSLGSFLYKERDKRCDYSQLSLLNVFDLFYLLLSLLLLSFIWFFTEFIHQNAVDIQNESTIRSKSKFINDWNLKNDKTFNKDI